MDERAELAALRRMAELEAKAAGTAPAQPATPATATPIVKPPRDEMAGMDPYVEAPRRAGEFVNDQLAKFRYVPNELAAGMGAGTNAMLGLIPSMLGANVGGAVGGLAEPASQSIGKWLMQKALKPTQKDLNLGKADRAITTMLEEGVNVSRGGMDKLRTIGTDLNSQASQEIAQSTAKIDKQPMIDALRNTQDKFAFNPSAVDDFALIKAEGNRFANHPKLADIGAREAELEALVAQKQAAHAKALQDSGRYQTMAAQQEHLASGGKINSALGREPGFFESFIRNEVPTGSSTFRTMTGTGHELPAAAPHAAPYSSGPYMGGNYSENILRVPEAKSAAADSLAIALQRQNEARAAALELEAHRAAGGSGIPVQTAQAMKQGYYKELKDDYGMTKSATEEAKKMIASALRAEIEKGVPSVVPINKRASDIWNALNVGERRALIAGNNNPTGLATLAANPKAAALFQLDRSSLAKSLAARAFYSGQLPTNAGRAAGYGAILADQIDE